MRRAARLSCLVAILPLHPANSANQHIDVAVETAVPVFQGNVKRPYVVIGHIKDNLRKPFAFMADPTKEKIYAEIWERGRKMGADAVINARYGETKRTLFNHGSTPISGTAIKYTNEGKPGN